MNETEQLIELQNKIALLSQQMDEYREEITLLKREVEVLKGKPIYRAANVNQVVNAKPTPLVPNNNFENLIGLKLIHFVGIVVLIIGLSIGVKYAIDINLITPLLRIVLAYLAGGVLLFLSLKLSNKYELFSMILFSGAMASGYFTTYAAFAYYDIFSRPLAFGIMVALTVFTVFNSLKYNRQQIAILGLVGAYGIPFFVRGNEDNLLLLFSYIFFINTAILFLSFKKYWLSLVFIAFFTTWLIYIGTVFLNTDKTLFNGKVTFSILFFCQFIISGLGYKIYKKQPITILDNLILVFNSLFLFFSLLALYNSATFTKILTLFFSVAYCIVATLVIKQQKYLSNILYVISVIMFCAYIPQVLDGLVITILWGVLALLLFAIGLVCKMQVFRVCAILLFATTLLKLLAFDSNDFGSVEKIIAYLFTGTIILIVSFLYQKFKKRIFNDAE